jgi:hypothetical protein
LEEFIVEEGNDGRKILWNLKNWDFKKKNKKKFGKKRRKKKRDYENSNQQFLREPEGWPNGDQLPSDYRMFQPENGRGMKHKPDWRNEIAGDEAKSKTYASSKKTSEVILDPVVDSSKFKASSLEVDIQPAVNLASNSKSSRNIRVVEWPHPIREIETPPQIILSQNTDNELKKISEKVSLQEPNANTNESFTPDKKSETSSISKRRRYKIAPKEGIKLRQELETYRQMYAESFDEANAALENKSQQDIKA